MVIEKHRNPCRNLRG